MLEKTRERRRHIVYITMNSEYHCRDRECVGVRCRMTGRWQIDHPALRGKLLGGIINKTPTRDPPRAGYRLVFGKEGLVMTTKVLYKGRPEKESIYSYANLTRAGEICA
jgi:hypothetical protein